eukprot:5757773-Alexandrium_andersonii.AAC.2
MPKSAGSRDSRCATDRWRCSASRSNRSLHSRGGNGEPAQSAERGARTSRGMETPRSARTRQCPASHP